MKGKRKFKVLVGVIIGIILLTIPINLMKKERNQQYRTINKYVVLGEAIDLECENEYNDSYVSLVKEFLSSLNSDIEYENLSEDGVTIDKLLKIVNSNNAKLSNADLITISIGGNNILKPTIEKMKSIIEEDNILLNNNDEEILNKKINEELNSQETKNEILKEINKFKKEFPMIISKVVKLSPDARIYVSTICNPIREESDIKKFLDDQIVLINDVIYSESKIYNYNIIDINKIFNESNCYFDLEEQNFNIHLNNVGHAFIASKIIEDYNDYVELRVNRLTNNSKSIKGTTVPNTKILVMSNNKTIATTSTNSIGKFEVKISPLKSGTDIKILVYDKKLFSILYKFVELAV